MDSWIGPFIYGILVGICVPFVVAYFYMRTTSFDVEKLPDGRIRVVAEENEKEGE